MLHPLAVATRDDLLRFCTVPGLAALTPETVARHRPQASWMLADGAGHVAACCSLWWQDTPALPGHRLGLIGHYAARDAEAAAQLLQLAVEQLAMRGRTLAVGPLDGTAWNR